MPRSAQAIKLQQWLDGAGKRADFSRANVKKLVQETLLAQDEIDDVARDLRDVAADARDVLAAEGQTVAANEATSRLNVNQQVLLDKGLLRPNEVR